MTTDAPKKIGTEELGELIKKLIEQRAGMIEALKNPGPPPKYIVHLHDVGLMFKIHNGVPFGTITPVSPHEALRMSKREARQFASIIKDAKGERAKSSRWETSCTRLIAKTNGYLKILEGKIGK